MVKCPEEICHSWTSKTVSEAIEEFMKGGAVIAKAI
jgi:hypothetical protein